MLVIGWPTRLEAAFVVRSRLSVHLLVLLRVCLAGLQSARKSDGPASAFDELARAKFRTQRADRASGCQLTSKQAAEISLACTQIDYLWMEDCAHLCLLCLSVAAVLFSCADPSLSH